MALLTEPAATARRLKTPNPGVLEVRLISENAVSGLRAQGFLEADCVTGSAGIGGVLGKAVYTGDDNYLAG